MFKLSDKRLDTTVKIKDAIEDKAFKFITILTPVQTAAITLLVSITHNNYLNISILTSLSIAILFIFIALFSAIAVFKPKSFYLPGNQPKNLWKPELLKQKDVFIIFNEAYHQQYYITCNDQWNKHSAAKLETSINAFWWALILSLSVYILLKYFIA